MIPSPQTNAAVRVSQTAKDLFDAAEKDPTAKADLQMLFDSINHGAPWLSGVVALAGMQLRQHDINIDDQIVNLVIGGLVVGASYVYQWVKIKMSKPQGAKS